MIKFKKYSLPAYWASYLINADDSGLLPSELETVLTWRNLNSEIGNCVACCDESYLARDNHATNIGGDCLDFIFEIKSVLV